MAEIISMPQLSDTMEEGTVIKWHKKIGDFVSEGDLLAEIETDKAIQDFEIDMNGTLLFIGVKEGETTRVNDILAIIGEKGEDITHILSKKNPSKTNVKKKEKDKKEEKIRTFSNQEEKRTFISPIARKMIKEMGIPIETVKNGSGDKGRIVKRDIPSHGEIPTLNSSNDHNNTDDTIPNSSMRKKIAKHLTFSKFSAPHYYLFSEINVDKLISLRINLNENRSYEEKISFNDLIIKASALALKKNPKVNVSWKENELLIHRNINIGFAVSIKEGLIVPVINNVDKKSISQISQEIKDKIVRSKSRKIHSEEMEDSTFTVSNLGMYGIDFFTSIINVPNSSILSIGSIIKRPIINKNSQIEIGNTMKITLSCDHRIIDGVLGSNYIHSFKEFLENPMNILI
ncbi:dihydrolipoamide acetyltransferase family protein [Blattabacterium cuenoti]|uniref:dihydrolipoamide acetyltransferase family protein n=1 Tax=Blattabacterium cuenoti TaxID=1653831 RepID=UPI00163D2768|nr:dihydrolipoamide acetyltransferase family protein [Blattabacterium cuenoti]